MWVAALFFGYFAGYFAGRIDRALRERFGDVAPRLMLDDDDLHGRLKRWNERRSR